MFGKCSRILIRCSTHPHSFQIKTGFKCSVFLWVGVISILIQNAFFQLNNIHSFLQFIPLQIDLNKHSILLLHFLLALLHSLHNAIVGTEILFLTSLSLLCDLTLVVCACVFAIFCLIILIFRPLLLFFISFSNQQFCSIFDPFSCAATVVGCNRQPLLKSNSIITAVSHIQQIRDAGDAYRDAKLHLLIKIFSINFSLETVRETHLGDKIMGIV
jgi:hypothetical protein